MTPNEENQTTMTEIRDESTETTNPVKTHVTLLGMFVFILIITFCVASLWQCIATKDTSGNEIPANVTVDNVKPGTMIFYNSKICMDCAAVKNQMECAVNIAKSEGLPVIWLEKGTPEYDKFKEEYNVPETPGIAVITSGLHQSYVMYKNVDDDVKIWHKDNWKEALELAKKEAKINKKTQSTTQQ